MFGQVDLRTLATQTDVRRQMWLEAVFELDSKAEK